MTLFSEQEFHTYPREPKVPIESNQGFYEWEVRESVVPGFLLQLQLAEFPPLDHAEGGLRVTGTPACTKHTLLNTLFRNGQIHHLRDDSVDSLIMSKSRVTHCYVNEVVTDPVTFGRKIYIMNMLMEQYLMSRLNNVLVNTTAVDSDTGAEIQLFPGEVGGPLMPMVSYTALNGVPEIDKRLLGLLGEYHWSPTVALHMDVGEVIDGEDDPKRAAVLSSIEWVRAIYSNLMHTTDFLQHVIPMPPGHEDISTRIEEYHRIILEQISERLPRPSERLIVDLMRLNHNLEDVMYGANTDTPMFYMSYLSKDRILIPSILEQGEFRGMIEDRLVQYFYAANRLVDRFVGIGWSGKELDIMNSDWFDQMQLEFEVFRDAPLQNVDSRLFLGTWDTTIYRHERMRFWAELLRELES